MSANRTMSYLYVAILCRRNKVNYEFKLHPVSCIEATTLAIKLFGIYSPTEHKTEFWDVVGKQLARKGNVYKDRYWFSYNLSDTWP